MIKTFILMLFPLLCWSQLAIQQARQDIENKLYIKAQQTVQNFLIEYPENIEAVELYGDTFGYLTKWDEAIDIYKKLVLNEPNNANYQYKYGGALAMKAQSVSKVKALSYVFDAKDAFLKAAELDNNHIDTRWALVELYMQLPGILGGSFKKSLTYAEELEKISKVDGYLAKGYVYEYDDNPDKAEYYYKKAVQVGGSLTCYEKLSHFYEKQQKPESAIKTIETGFDKHQRNALHYQLGKVCAEYNLQLDKGEHCLKTYIKNYTAKDGVPVAWANYRLAQIYRHKSDKSSALAYIQLAIQELPDVIYFQKEREKISAL
jgi:tetratricopeptide (TPR) repeat protein